MLKSKYKDIQKSKYEQQKKAEILKAYAFLKPIRSPFRASDQIYFKSTCILRERNL